MAVGAKYDLYSPAFRASTYETFARMRDENPVFCQPGLDGETPIWFVTRYDDVLAVLRDDERFAAIRRSRSTRRSSRSSARRCRRSSRSSRTTC